MRLFGESLVVCCVFIARNFRDEKCSRYLQLTAVSCCEKRKSVVMVTEEVSQTFPNSVKIKSGEVSRD